MGLNKNRVQVMLSDETYEALKDAAARDRRTVSEWLRILIEDTLND